MQIQRLQSLYIFLAFVALAIFMIVPFGEVVRLADDPTLSVHDILYTIENPGIYVPVGAILLLLMVAIFFYRNLKAQCNMVVFTLVLTIALIAVICWALYKEAGAEGVDAHFSVWDILPVIAMILEIMAIGAIKHDIRLLNSYNRLR